MSPSLGTRWRCPAGFLNNLERRGAGVPAGLLTSPTSPGGFPAARSSLGSAGVHVQHTPGPQHPSPCPKHPPGARTGWIHPKPFFEFFLFSFSARLHGHGGGGDGKLAGHRASLHPSLRRGKGGKKEKGKKHPAGVTWWPPPCRVCRSLPRSLRGRGWAADTSARSRCPRARGNTGTKPSCFCSPPIPCTHTRDFGGLQGSAEAASAAVFHKSLPEPCPL